MRELILGGQKSGKSARAELLAAQWLAQSPAHAAVFIATARPWDDEMRERIARHQCDRAVRVPGMRTVEEPLALAEAIFAHSAPGVMVVVDCLTLWLTNLLMPVGSLAQSPHPNPLPEGEGANGRSPSSHLAAEAEGANGGFSSSSLSLWERAGVRAAAFTGAVAHARAPLVLVSNEIGLGVIPMGRDVRAFVDALGRLNQQVAAACDRVTFMAAGLPLTLKGDVS